MKTESTIIWVLFLVVFGGCFSTPTPEGMPKLYPTVLTITQDGNPLEDADVVIFMENPLHKRWGSGGKTDSNGKVDLYTLGKYQGVPAGNAIVFVAKTENEPTPPGLSEGGLEAFEKKRKSYYIVDPKYSDPVRTPLKIEIKPGLNEKTFDVGKAMRQEIK